MGPGDMRLQVINVGKINLYLQKYEIGTNHETFAKPMLIPAGSNSYLLISIRNYALSQNMDIKLFLVDELNEKFISTGEVKIEEIQIVKEIPQLSGATPSSTYQTVKVPQASAWAYKTKKQNWEI